MYKTFVLAFQSAHTKIDNVGLLQFIEYSGELKLRLIERLVLSFMVSGLQFKQETRQNSKCLPDSPSKCASCKITILTFSAPF